MEEDRKWMYEGRIVDGFLSSEWADKVDGFVKFSLQHPELVNDGTHIKCPCPRPKCQNKQFLHVDEVKVHLYRYGFVEDYYIWKYHGEKELIRHRCLVRDVAGPSNVNQVRIESESTN